MKCRIKITILITVVLLSGCFRPSHRSSVKPLKSFASVNVADINFQDDLDPASLESAINHSINYYENSGRNKVYKIAGRTINAEQLKETLTEFREILQGARNSADLRKKIASEFKVYRVTGSDSTGS
jgi:PBP1b-binding outer membrane lipoprotein LpoB